MNVEALLEDLEAQGYFASTKDDEPELQRLFCRSVLVIRENLPDIYLAMPLKGKNFIAGFQNRITKSSWLIIREYSYLKAQDLGSELQETKLSINAIAQAHLIGVPLRLGVKSQNAELNGYITKSFSKTIEFVSFEADRLWIPTAQLNYLVVEKLSINSQV
jgi:hypothetical protein